MSEENVQGSPDAFREALKEDVVAEPKIEQKQEAAPPEPPPQKPKKYIKRAFSILFGPNDNYVQIEGNFFQLENGMIDVEGKYIDKPFDSTNELLQIANFSETQKNQFVERMQKLLKS